MPGLSQSTEEVSRVTLGFLKGVTLLDRVLLLDVFWKTQSSDKFLLSRFVIKVIYDNWENVHSCGVIFPTLLIEI